MHPSGSSSPGTRARRVVGFAVAALAGSWGLLAPRPAWSQEVETCITAHEQGQRLRKQGKLSSARAELEACTKPSCPAPIQRDCAEWREEIVNVLPTVVISVTDGEDGPQLDDVTVLVDGEVLQRGLDGRALPVDPGERSFRFEAADGRSVERRLVILEGVKNRVVRVALSEEEDSGGGPAEEQAWPATVPPSFWAAGAIGVVGFAGFGILGGVGLSKESSLRNDCAGSCTQDEVDEVRSFYIVADVMGVVGIAGLATAAVIGIVTVVGEDEPDDAVEVLLSPAGAGLRLRF